MKTLIVVQARTGSTRLPGKVLLPVAGAPMLTRMVERLRAVRTPADIVVATTIDPSDEPIVALCRAASIDCFRGHPTDLLDRHYQAAKRARADVIVKIPSDCPLIDPAVVDRVLAAHLGRGDRVDFTSNLHPPTYPDGNDVEAMSYRALATAWRRATRPFEREHTTPFLWDNDDHFRVANVAWETGEDLSTRRRLTVDYEEDYALVRAVYAALYTPERPIFTLADILAFLEERPQIRALNAKWLGHGWQRAHEHELRTFRRANAAPMDGQKA